MRRKITPNISSQRMNVYCDKETARKLAEIQAMFEKRWPNVPSLSSCFQKSLDRMYQEIKGTPGALEELYAEFKAMSHVKHKELMKDTLHAHKNELLAALNEAELSSATAELQQALKEA